MKKLRISPCQVAVSLVFLILLTSIGMPQAADLSGMSGPVHDNNTVAVSPQAYGISGDSITTVGAVLFRPLSSSSAVDFNTFGFASTNPGNDTIIATPDLPSGVLVNGMELEACDTSVTEGVFLNFLRCDKAPVFDCELLGSIYTGSEETPGCNVFTLDISSVPVEIKNANFMYFLVIREYDDDFSTSYRGVRVFWRRQVSPAPSTPTFNDVSTSHPLFQYIEAFAASGITSGYDDYTFRPSQPVTRGQMAVFLSKALGLHWPN
jgi:hypothetical protein